MKKVLSMLTMVVMLAACSESETLADTDPEPTLGVEIISGTNVDPFGAKEGTLDDAPENSLTAYVYATRLDGSNAYVSYAPENIAAEGYMTFVSASEAVDGKYPIAPVGFQKEDTTATGSADMVLIADPQYYPGQEALYMAGLVPANKTRWTFDADSKVASCAIDGRTDIMVGVATTMNDGVKLIKKSNASATVYPVFDFKHKLTLVRVKVYAPHTVDVNAWGKITKIEASSAVGVAAGVHNVLDVTLEDGTGGGSGADTGVAIPFYYYGPIGDNTNDVYTGLQVSTEDEKTADNTAYYGPIEIPHPATAEDAEFTAADAKFVGYSMIAPFDAIAGVNLTLTLYSEKYPTGVSAKVGALYTDAAHTTPHLGSTEGMKFDVTLKLTGVEISASATITEWKDGYTEDIEL